MADEQNAPVVPEQQTQQNNNQEPSKEPLVGDTPSQEWKKTVGDKFATPEDLAKSYKELETKLGSQGDEIRKTQEFAAVIQPLLDEIRNDPVLFSTLDERLRKKGQPDNTQPNTQANDQKVDEARSVASDLILARFEDKYGITKLPESERADLRANIGKAIERLTGKSFNAVDLRQLNGVLEDAYFIANKEALIDRSKLEALAGVTDASIPGIPSSPGKSEEGLSPEEARVADRLGLTRDQYTSGKLKK